MIPIGTYTARAKTARLGETKGGKEQVGVVFEITSGDQAGQAVPWYGYFTDATARRTIESLRYMGWTGDDVADLSTIEAAPAEVSITVEHSEYNGRVSARVGWVNAPGSGIAVKVELDAAKRAALSARMRGLVVEVTKSVPARAGVPAYDDDLPF